MGWLFGNKSNRLSITNEDRRYIERSILWLMRYSYQPASFKYRLHLPTENEFPELDIDPKSGLIKLVDRLSTDLGLQEQVTITVFNKQSLNWDTWRTGFGKNDRSPAVIQVREELFRFKAHLIASILLDLSCIKLAPLYKEDEDMGNEPEIQSTMYGYGVFNLCAYTRVDVPFYHQPWMNANMHIYAMSLMCRFYSADHTIAQPFLDDNVYELLDRLIKEHESSDSFLEFKRHCNHVLMLAPLLRITIEEPVYSQKLIETYTKLISLEEDANYYNNRGYAYLLNGNYGEAIADFNSCIERDPYYAYAFNNRSLARMLSGDLKSGLTDLNTSEALDPNNSFNYRNRGIYFLLLGQPEQALPHLQRAITMDSNTEHIHYWLGKAYFALSNLQEAKIQFDLSKIKPELPAPVYPI